MFTDPAITFEGASADESAPQQQPTDLRSLHRKLEALLFVASEALPLERLVRLTGAEAHNVATALAELEALYADRGITLRAIAGGYRFATATCEREVVEAYLLPPKTSLSPAALETLAIAAYAQPVTKAEIEAIRGVNVDGVVSALVERGFLQEMGRKETIGRPMLFGTTTHFLEAFGLQSLAELPPLPPEQAERLLQEQGEQPLMEGETAPTPSAEAFEKLALQAMGEPEPLGEATALPLEGTLHEQPYLSKGTSAACLVRNTENA